MDRLNRPRLEEAFPVREPPFEASGPWVLVQDRTIPEQTRGGIILPDPVRDNTTHECVAMICSIGPLAGRTALGDLMEGWPWFEPGDYVLAPRYSSGRYMTRDGIIYRCLKATEVFGIVRDLDEVLR